MGNVGTSFSKRNSALSKTFIVVGISSVCLLGCREPEINSSSRPGSTDQAQDRKNESVLPKPSPNNAESAHASNPTDAVDPLSNSLFTDVTARLGLPSSVDAWPDGLFMTPEITPGGVALFDFDHDGDLDIYQICHCPPTRMPRSFQHPAPNRLFRQEPSGRFVEVVGAAGLDDPGYGHGVTIGDFDNDGDDDVFVTNYGPNRLYANNGSGQFADVTSSAGIRGQLWSSASAFFDYDRDGDLDLFVVNFAAYDPSKRCLTNETGEEDYCGPHKFPGVADQLYRNNGNGTFTDISEQVGMVGPSRGWGTICADLTQDGWPDIYVANDEEPNQLWVGAPDGTFFDEAVLRGVAFNGAGRVEASMGVTVADIDGDHRLDFFMTHVSSETNTLYASGDGGEQEMYVDGSAKSGMARYDLPYTGWGCGFLDYDHDGDVDLAVANGRVSRGTLHPNAHLGDFWNRYAETNFLFRNDGNGRFTNVSAEAGGFGNTPQVTRGLAFGDLDRDGDLDMVGCNLDNTLVVYVNNAPKSDNHWVMIRAKSAGRDSVGARIEIVASGKKQIRLVLPSYSYLASNDPAVHFGLGPATKVDSLHVLWPDGSREVFAPPRVDTCSTVVQSTGNSEL